MPTVLTSPSKSAKKKNKAKQAAVTAAAEAVAQLAEKDAEIERLRLLQPLPGGTESSVSTDGRGNSVSDTSDDNVESPAAGSSQVPEQSLKTPLQGLRGAAAAGGDAKAEMLPNFLAPLDTDSVSNVSTEGILDFEDYVYFQLLSPRDLLCLLSSFSLTCNGYRVFDPESRRYSTVTTSSSTSLSSTVLMLCGTMINAASYSRKNGSACAAQ